jgi:glutathione S-transferase
MNEDIMDQPSNALMEFNVFGWPWTGLVTLLTILIYLIFAYKVVLARKKFGIAPPETSGPPDFLRILRTQLNTSEYMVVFLTLLWLAALSSNDVWAASIGVFWPISRILYALGYYREAKRRLTGFILGNAAMIALFVLSAVQIVRSLFIWQ